MEYNTQADNLEVIEEEDVEQAQAILEDEEIKSDMKPLAKPVLLKADSRMSVQLIVRLSIPSSGLPPQIITLSNSLSASTGKSSKHLQKNNLTVEHV
jgi:hypothetical protein